MEIFTPAVCVNLYIFEEWINTKSKISSTKYIWQNVYNTSFKSKTLAVIHSNLVWFTQRKLNSITD